MAPCGGRCGRRTSENNSMCVYSTCICILIYIYIFVDSRLQRRKEEYIYVYTERESARERERERENNRHDAEHAVTAAYSFSWLGACTDDGVIECWQRFMQGLCEASERFLRYARCVYSFYSMRGQEDFLGLERVDRS